MEIRSGEAGGRVYDYEFRWLDRRLGIEVVDGRRVLRNKVIKGEDLSDLDLGGLLMENVRFEKGCDIDGADFRRVKIIFFAGKSTVHFACKGIPLCDSIIADVIARDYTRRIKSGADNSLRTDLPNGLRTKPR